MLKVLERVQSLNEGWVQRDVTPWVVPSAEVLFYCGEVDANIIGDEVNAEWTRCATMGSTLGPKPDYAAGLLPSSFTEDEMLKLKNYASPSRPVFFTPDLCFPSLICEVKTGEQGLNKADRQNIQSASIAAKGVIELFKTAFGDDSEQVKDLNGQVLVFTEQLSIFNIINSTSFIYILLRLIGCLQRSSLTTTAVKKVQMAQRSV